MANPRTFIPFGAFLPDRKLFGNEGLLRAFGVVPVAGNYIQAPAAQSVAGGILISDPPWGMGAHQVLAGGALERFVYFGSENFLYEVDVDDTGTITGRTRTSGGNYAFATTPGGAHDMWWFTSFGNNVVATNFDDAVQYLATPGSGNFADMITSTFKPQFRFVVPIRQNLFGFYCYLPATYDGIPSGTHPQLGVWSMYDNIQAFGSENVDPALLGAGYQQNIGGDLGPITAAIGGDFGLVFLTGGIVRVDGPPYEFRTIVEGDSTLYPYSVFRLGNDVYFWGNGGPSVLRGGEAPVVALTEGIMERSLLDNRTGFGADFARGTASSARDISGAPDPVARLCRWGYPPVANAAASVTEGGNVAHLMLDYAIREGRFAVSKTPGLSDGAGGYDEAIQAYFMRQAPPNLGTQWGPFRDTFVMLYDPDQDSYELVKFSLGATGSTAPAIEIRTGYGRLSDTNATRIQAVRPIWSNTSGLATAIEAAVSVTIHTRNKPWEDDHDSSVHTVINDDGWIGTDSAIVGTYHSVTLAFGTGVTEIEEIHELEGVEIQYVVGPEYGT